MGKWSLREDYIIFRFCNQHKNKMIVDELLDELQKELEEAGFDFRSRNAIKRRAHTCQCLICKWEVPHAPIQQMERCNVLLHRINEPGRYEELQAAVKAYYVCDEHYTEELVLEKPQGNHFLYTDALEPSFKDVLLRFIQKSGRKDADIYNASLVTRDKFNRILNPRKGKELKRDSVGVSKRTIMQLCIGLKLTYEEAVVLMESAGYAFRRNDLTEVIVAICLRERICNMTLVNVILEENGEKIFGKDVNI